MGALAREGNVCELVTAAATAGRAWAIGGGGESVQGRWHPPGVGTESATWDEEPEQEVEDADEENDPSPAAAAPSVRFQERPGEVTAPRRQRKVCNEGRGSGAR